MSRLILSILLSAASLCAAAIEPAEVEAAVEAAKASPRNRALARKAGDALKQAGDYRNAITWYLKSDNSGNLGAAEAAFYLYDFEQASNYLERYLAKRTKAEAERDRNFSFRPDGTTSDWTDYLSEKISLGSSMLDRVETIEVIDSVNVNAETFFNALRLARSAGHILGDESARNIVTDNLLDSLGLSDLTGTAFASESGEDIIWAAHDTEGNSTMFESRRLADGSWDDPATLFSYSTIFGNDNGAIVSYPFLMSDGVTLYFAADGDESLGGLDIFISRRDEKGFLQPSNIGMPYNSPYNDYLYAVDEETGAGWWVTDRNKIPGMVTVYTFIPRELRINYPADTPALADFAKLSSIASTQGEGSDYSQLLRRIRNIDNRATATGRSDEFEFAMPDGRVLRRMSDLRSPMARNAMKNYLKACKELSDAKARLAAMREAYAKGDRSNSEAIIALEDKLDTMRAGLVELSNQVVLTEQ